MLRFSLLHFLRLRRVEDAGYPRRVYFIKMRSATVNLRTVRDIHRSNVDAISIELRRRGTDRRKHLRDLGASSLGVWTTGIAWSWTPRSVNLCVLIPCPPTRDQNVHLSIVYFDRRRSSFVIFREFVFRLFDSLSL